MRDTITQHAMPTALAHLQCLVFFSISLPALPYPTEEPQWLDADEERRLVKRHAKIAAAYKMEIVRVRALRKLPYALVDVLPSLRVITVNDDRPEFHSDAERFGWNVEHATHLQDGGETAHALQELRELAADSNPTREWRSWRVDIEGKQRNLEEVWSGKAELAGEMIERPDFNPDKDLECEPFPVSEQA